MITLPSVGSQVKKIVLNESATKARIYFDDGSSAIISTQSTPNKKVVKKAIATPNCTTFVKKSVSVKHEAAGMPHVYQTKTINTSNGKMNIPVVNEKRLAVLESKKESVIERAKARAAAMDEEMMDASQRMAMSAEEGMPVNL